MLNKHNNKFRQTPIGEFLWQLGTFLLQLAMWMTLGYYVGVCCVIYVVFFIFACLGLTVGCTVLGVTIALF